MSELSQVMAAAGDCHRWLPWHDSRCPLFKPPGTLGRTRDDLVAAHKLALIGSLGPTAPNHATALCLAQVFYLPG